MTPSTPSVPDAVKPKVPIKAQLPSTTRGATQSTSSSVTATTPRGRESLIAAGRLDRRATTLKSSLLG